MKVDLIRHSGLPIDEDGGEKYQEIWKKRYDSIYKDYEAQKITMQEVEDSCALMQKELSAEFPTSTMVNFPNSNKAWFELCTMYKAPCLVTHRGKKMLIVIMDLGI